MSRQILLLCVLVLLLVGGARGQERRLETSLPATVGVSTHWVDPDDTEMGRFVDLGTPIFRVDLVWERVELEPGRYDFSVYDRLLERTRARGLRALFILGYTHPRYDQGQAPHTPQGIAAFSRFAETAARRYRGRVFAYEIWGEPQEPNGNWPPKPNAAAYTRFAIAVGDAVRRGDPEVLRLAPGTASFAFEFVEKVFRAGLLEHVDAVSVHPYRAEEPENAAVKDYAQLRALIARYAPRQKRNMPIVISEWGYVSGEKDVTLERQAEYATRMYLSSLAMGVPLCIWYDLVDDYLDPKHPGSGSGLLGSGAANPPYAPKPAYLALQRLLRELKGFRLVHRQVSPDNRLWSLLLRRGRELVRVTWTTDRSASPQQCLPTLQRIEAGSPNYPDLLRTASIVYSMEPLAVAPEDSVRLMVTVQNPTTSPAVLRIDVGGARQQAVRLEPQKQRLLLFDIAAPRLRDETDTPVRVRAWWNGKPIAGLTTLTIRGTAPLALAISQPQEATEPRVRVSNPARTAFRGQIRLLGTTRSIPLVLAAGSDHAEIVLPGQSVAGAQALALESADGQPVLPPVPLPSLRFTHFARVVGPAVRSLLADAGQFPASDQAAVGFVTRGGRDGTALTLRRGAASEPEGALMSLTYRFADSAQSILVQPERGLVPPAQAKALCFWLFTDHADYPRCLVVDATGQTFAVTLERSFIPGWRLVTVPLEGVYPAHYGGADDGRFHPPLRITALLHLDRGMEGEGDRVARIALPHYLLSR